MGLLWMVADEEYQPGFATLVVRDTGRGACPSADEVLGEAGGARVGSGTLACAGNGWLMAGVGDGCHRVRLEAHDCRPGDDVAAWSDVLETPYGSATGLVELTWLTGRPNAPTVQLGAPGRYRVRVSRRAADDEGDVWRLQCWPDEAAAPPRWLARARPAAPGRHDRRFAALAADVVAVARWAPGANLTTTGALLARRLLVSPEEVWAAVRLAVADGLLAVAGDLTITALPGRPVAVRSSYVQPVAPGAPWQRRGGAGIPGRPGPYRPPWGDPPRAGIVGGGGQVLVWRDGARVELGRWPGGDLRQAVETAHGVVLAGAGVVLVGADGGTRQLAEGRCRVAVSADGQLLAIEERHEGRRPWCALHLVDLATATCDTLAIAATPVAVHDGTVYLATTTGTLRWTPGSDPQPVGYRIHQIDPLTGTQLADDGGPQLVVIRPDGSRQPLPPGTRVLLPGGEHASAFGSRPTSVRWQPLAGHTTGRETALPPDTVTRGHDARRPVWESPHRMLVVVGGLDAGDLQTPLLRVDAATGDFERIPLEECIGIRGLVVPLPHRRPR